jgi:hypothetical protein
LATPLPSDNAAAPPESPPGNRQGARLRLASGQSAPTQAGLTPPLSVWSVILGSRVLLFVVGYLTVSRFHQSAYARRLTYNRPELLLGTAGRWLNSWANWDGQWYVRIARVGYRGRSYAAFFPLYPVLVRWLAPLAADSYIVAGIGLSLVFYVAAMYLLYRLIDIDYGRQVAGWTVVFASLCPTSFFFQAVYTESAFLLFVVACLFFARRGQWLFAGVAGFFATLTRNTGILLLLPMALLYLDACNWRPRRIDRRVAWFALVPAGLAVWMVYLQAKLGDPFAFSLAQRHWHRRLTAPWIAVEHGLRSGVSGIVTILHHGQETAAITAGGTLPVSSEVVRSAVPNALALVALLVAVTVLALAARRIKLPYLVYGFASLAAPLFYPTPRQPLYSMPRFVVVIFPVFLAFALLTRRLPATRTALLVGSALGLVLLTSLFARFFFVA